MHVSQLICYSIICIEYATCVYNDIDTGRSRVPGGRVRRDNTTTNGYD